MVGGAGNKRKLVGQQGTTLAHTPGSTGYNGVPMRMGELTAPLLLVSCKWPICPDGSAVVAVVCMCPPECNRCPDGVASVALAHSSTLRVAANASCQLTPISPSKLEAGPACPCWCWTLASRLDTRLKSTCTGASSPSLSSLPSPLPPSPVLPPSPAPPPPAPTLAGAPAPGLAPAGCSPTSSSESTLPPSSPPANWLRSRFAAVALLTVSSPAPAAASASPIRLNDLTRVVPRS